MRVRVLVAGVISLLLFAVAAGPRFAVAQKTFQDKREVTTSREKVVTHVLDCGKIRDNLVVGDEYTFRFTVTNNTDSEITEKYTFEFDPESPAVAADILENKVSITGSGSFSVDDTENSVEFTFVVPANDQETGEATWEARSEYVEQNGIHNRGNAEFKGAHGEATDACEMAIHLRGSITVTKYEDLNADGDRDSDEPGLGNWEMKVEGTDVTGIDQSATGTTRSNGTVTFTDWRPGGYTVSETLKSGWTNSQPGDRNYDLTLTSGGAAELVFGNWEPAGLGGVKYEDLDADGTRDSGEPGLENWTIELDNGATTTTGSDGSYSFTGLDPGTYTVTEVKKSGWTQSEGGYTVTLESGEFREGLNFGNWRPGSIHGKKWRDDDGDGTKDVGEPGLQGWTIKLDTGASTTTDANGDYSFTGLDPDTYTVSEKEKSGWTQTHPPGGTHTVALQSGQSAEAQNFGNVPPPGSIHGQKFFDKNGNGQRDVDSDGDGTADSLEVGLNGFVIELYDSDGNLVAVDTTHSMDLNGDDSTGTWHETGLFWFEGLPPDTYTVRERGPEDPWTKTVPSGDGHTVDLEAGERVSELLFGNTLPADQLDFGDLPSPKTGGPLAPACGIVRQCYSTLIPPAAGLPPPGPRHVIKGPFLGAVAPDAEGNGQPDPAAQGDDTDPGGDDEDGFQSLTFNGGVGTITYQVNAPNGAWLSAWIDFDNDGILRPAEKVCAAKFVAKVGNVKCNFPVPPALHGGYVRARISTDSASVKRPFGLAPDGEVEDHLGLPGTDGGDAPDSTLGLTPQSPVPFGYPTRHLDDGAIHAFGGNARLGDTQTDVDQGLPSRLADGDDEDFRDDEDGILLGEGATTPPFNWLRSDPGCFVSPPDRRVPGDDGGEVIYLWAGLNVEFLPLATKTGFFSGWIDWNRDGDWQDDGEQIFDGKSIATGPTFTTLTFDVPTEGSLVDLNFGWTFARFRYSTVEDQMSPTGLVTSGEVEDCLIRILPNLGPDFGDAPQPYPTLSADSGAAHIGSRNFNLHLGATPVRSWDVEMDGQPSPGVQGDDTDKDGDDEDGVTVPDSLHPGTTAQIEVTVTASGARTGFLNAWFDWNQDGDWQDADEHVVVDEELGDGTHTLSLTVPEDAELGPTVARFRLSETGGLTPRWTANMSNPDPPVGEVEDHRVDVKPEDASESGSAVIDEDEKKKFGPTGLTIGFCNVKNAGVVSVYKGDDRPKNVQNFPKANVSGYSFTIEALGPLSFGNCTELRFAVSALEGIENDPTAVTVFRREETDRGDFSSLPTSVDDNGTPNDITDDVLVATVGSFSEFALGSDSEPLPVELTRFEATVRNENVLLTWRTASETNNAGFHVQRRVASASEVRNAPGGGKWIDLGFVEGAGTTESPQTYEFVDENLPFAADSLKYRLRQVNVDGTSSFSNEITVRRRAPQSVRLLGAYPNPARAQTTVRYSVPTRQGVRLALYDALGRRVMTLLNRTVDAGRRELRLDASQLSPGVYLLRLVAGGRGQTRRVTVIR